MSKTQKLLLSLLVVGLVGTVAGMGTFAAFTSTTSNDNNVFAAGTVYITDNDSGSVMYNVSNKAPGYSTTACIKVTYGGTLPADVKLYWTPNGSDNLSTYITLTVDKLTYAQVSDEPGSFPGCGTPSSTSNLYTGNLSAFGTTYAGGYSAYPGAQTQWNQNNYLFYRFTVALQDNNGANGGATAKSTGTHSFTWEAHNQ